MRGSYNLKNDIMKIYNLILKGSSRSRSRKLSQSLSAFLFVHIVRFLHLSAGGKFTNLAFIGFRGPGRSSFLDRQATENAHALVVFGVRLNTSSTLAAFEKDTLVAESEFPVLPTSFSALGTNLSKAQ